MDSNANYMTAQVTYETKSETMKVTACRPTSYGGYNSKPHGYGGEHQVCKEEYQTQEYRVPRVDEPLEVSVDLTLPTPKQVCQKETIEYTETVCEDQEEQRCITFAKLDDASVTVDQVRHGIRLPHFDFLNFKSIHLAD